MDDAVQTVMTQCELWTDNNDMERADDKVVNYEKSRLKYLRFYATFNITK